ncbi:mannosyl-3-phosphoglycerate phosphatase-related protein [Pantoea allii]|uniref:Mannosyl-3-phosphoglycerate phosphatase-related protein n=1 Tax=Pantoea allii TaxID=574096 RepID=A0ABS6V8N4_9GAMM|nr:mannosyl-3-phosphoglycerate phosphatase-related protein [Pantoea allii]MBW1212708.1 mannosyl-3-phosphoglycerate phosphatase-related protein [Pantoea allii]MBW1255654.1 mannosyl-3-phosphoglycerate phosphatase-related protein [Pantoea allii]MBW1264731.1 mannosyl-3-phosphoglycerate phosphatase-related protein [Pantoea allii]MBW1286848.1 mannosyl-3-phosphoglycerate phosphatase-related protein [Pantoea allii]
MPNLNESLMIVTDLDGSLLDHHDYNWDAAAEWLDRLRQHAVPLIICSSKTAAEILPLQRKLGVVGAPFIAENGAVLYLDDSKSVRIPDDKMNYKSICRVLATLRQQFRFTGFHDFSDVDVSSMTGLSEADAALARQRDASEVIVWRDTDEAFNRFRAALADYHLSLTQGGRFWHVMPARSGKGEALRWLLSHQTDQPYITVGLGDGPNDAPMLDAVDYAVVIKGYSKTPVTLQRADNDRVFHTTHHGPEGWLEGLDHFLTQP